MSKYIPAFNYDFLTPLYDSILNLIGFGERQRIKIVNLFYLKPKEKLLDVGCGTGSLLVVAKQKHPKTEMIGIEPDRKVLEIAAKKIKSEGLNIKLIKVGAEKLPFANSSFDVIVSTLVFHHLPTNIKHKALKEIRRVLKPKGRFFLIDFGKITGLLKLIYYLEILLRIPEAKTVKDNVDGKIPQFLKQASFSYKEIAPPYLGIRYIEAHKNPRRS